MTYNLNNTETIITIKRDNIIKSKEDVMLCWLNEDLKSNSKRIFDIHREGGMMMIDSVLNYETNINKINDCDVFTVDRTMLNNKMVLYGITPYHKINYKRAYDNIAATIKSYKKNNMCRSLALYVEEAHELQIECINMFLSNIGLKTITIYVNQDEESKITKILTSGKYIKRLTFKEKIDKLFDNLLEKIGKINIKSINRIWK